MNAIAQVQTRRSEVVQKMLAIRSMQKGTVNEQFFPVVKEGKKTGERRGPYHVHTYKKGKKTVSKRLKTKDAVDLTCADTANYRRFRDLCAEFEELTEDLGRLEREAGASEEALKKGLYSRSSRTRK